MSSLGNDTAPQPAEGGAAVTSAELTTAGVDIVARGLSVRGPRGPVFENVDVEVPAGGLLVVHGPAGSGRTSLLLALAGRMRFVTGAVRVGGYELPARGKLVRRLVALARAEPAAALEGRLRVGELISERTWLARRVSDHRVDAAFALLGIDPPRKALVEDLDPATGCLVAVALALAGRPHALVVDDADGGCTPPGRQSVWHALDRVRATGCTVLAAGTDPPPSGPLPPSMTTPVPVVLPRRSDDAIPRERREGRRTGEQEGGPQ